MRDNTINPGDVLFMVTKDHVRAALYHRLEVFGSDWTDELINQHMDKFEQALEWYLLEVVHEVVNTVALDIECEYENGGE